MNRAVCRGQGVKERQALKKSENTLAVYLKAGYFTDDIFRYKRLNLFI